MTKVFVSSTVYDLLDVRAEVDALLNEMHLAPVMSDSGGSDFTIHTDLNSVECCLANLRSCNVVVVILCQRYGPRIPGMAGGSFSATHLEYREAKENGLPIYMYVRDRLEADRCARRRNSHTSYRPVWATGDGAEQLLDFLEEHKSLTQENGGTNWFSTFRDSCDLKDLIRRDLRLPASRADLEHRIQANEMPWVQASLRMPPEASATAEHFHLCLCFVNHGSVPAFQCTWHLEGEEEVTPMRIPLLAPGQETFQTILVSNDGTPKQWKLTVEYFNATGHRVSDRYDAGLKYAHRLQALCGASFVGKAFSPSDGSVTPYDILDSHTSV